MDNATLELSFFTQNGERQIKHHAIIEILRLVAQQVQAEDRRVREHFNVDGACIRTALKSLDLAVT
jgi:hypothetical protein